MNIITGRGSDFIYLSIEVTAGRVPCFTVVYSCFWWFARSTGGPTQGIPAACGLFVLFVVAVRTVFIGEVFWQDFSSNIPIRKYPWEIRKLAIASKEKEHGIRLAMLLSEQGQHAMSPPTIYQDNSRLFYRFYILKCQEYQNNVRGVFFCVSSSEQYHREVNCN